MKLPEENLQRIKFIDGLRAVAVLMVVLFHFYYQQMAQNGDVTVTPAFLQQVFQYGNMGVYIFFVISGFIVSYVTYGQVTSLKFIARFIVKRQVRLDPPFWLAVIMGTALAYASVKFLHTSVYVPSAVDVIFNVTYIFDFFDRYDIIRVGWTLCLEIQFYLVFILLAFFITTYSHSRGSKLGIYFIFFIISLLSYWLFPIILHDYIITYWYVFFLGVAITLTVKNELTEKHFYVVISIPFLLLFTKANPVPVYFSSATALLIYFSFRFQKHQVWLSSRFFQFFGLISYSLYLTHCLIGNKIIRFLKTLFNWEVQNNVATLGILLFSITICTIFAYLFYVCIEKRSVKWSRTIASLLK